MTYLDDDIKTDTFLESFWRDFVFWRLDLEYGRTFQIGHPDMSLLDS